MPWRRTPSLGLIALTLQRLKTACMKMIRTVPDVVAVSGDDDIVYVVDYVIVKEVVLIHVQLVFPNMPCVERIHGDKKRRQFIGSQPGTKSGRRSADKPLINRASTACQPVIVFPHRFT